MHSLSKDDFSQAKPGTPYIYAKVCPPNTANASKKRRIFCSRIEHPRSVKFDDLMAAHYYATGTSFQRIECPYLQAAVNVLYFLVLMVAYILVICSNLFGIYDVCVCV